MTQYNESNQGEQENQESRSDYFNSSLDSGVALAPIAIAYLIGVFGTAIGLINMNAENHGREQAKLQNKPAIVTRAVNTNLVDRVSINTPSVTNTVEVTR